MKWIYVEDKQGNLIAKDWMNVGKAFDCLKEKGYTIMTKLESDNFILWRIY